MPCLVCQTKLKASAIFCDTCGAKVEKGSQATISLSKAQAKPSAPSPIAFAFGGAALVLTGIWVGATFFSATPVFPPRELPALPSQKQELKSDIVLVKETASAPVVPLVVAPVISEPIPAIKPQDDSLADPFKKIKPEATLKPKFDAHEDPFVSPAKKIGDKSLDPFQNKKDETKNAIDPGSVLDPFRSKKENPKNTTPKEPSTIF